MSRVCDLAGVGVLSGNKVSHSNRKTKRKFLPNLQNITLTSEILGQSFQMRVAVRTLRTIESKGGLDNYLLDIATSKLTEKGQSLKSKVKKVAVQQEENRVS